MPRQMALHTLCLRLLMAWAIPRRHGVHKAEGPQPHGKRRRLQNAGRSAESFARWRSIPFVSSDLAWPEQGK